MKLTVYRFAKSIDNYVPIEIECTGTGTENDPIIIIPSEKLPKDNLLIIINNCPSKKIYLVKCKYITINASNNDVEIIIRNSSDIIVKDHLKIKYLSILDSQNIEVKYNLVSSLEIFDYKELEINNCSINSNFELSGCFGVKIYECSISKLKFHRSYNNLIKDCTIMSLKNIHSRANKFEHNKLPQKYVDQLLKDPMDFRFIKLIVLISIVIIIISFLFAYIFIGRLIFIIILVGMAGLISVLAIIVFYFNEKRLSEEIKNSYPQNKII